MRKLPGLLLLGAAVVVTALFVAPRAFSVFYTMYDGGGQRLIAQAKCKEYYDAAGTWAQTRGAFPTRLEDMEAPLHPGESAFLEPVEDPWGNPYVLERSGADVRVRCVGPDGRAGTEDDIVYPDESK